LRNPEQRHIKNQVGCTACKAHSHKIEVQTSNTSPLTAVILLQIEVDVEELKNLTLNYAVFFP
jgi:hypothetical protein